MPRNPHSTPGVGIRFQSHARYHLQRSHAVHQIPTLNTRPPVLLSSFTPKIPPHTCLPCKAGVPVRAPPHTHPLKHTSPPCGAFRCGRSYINPLSCAVPPSLGGTARKKDKPGNTFGFLGASKIRRYCRIRRLSLIRGAFGVYSCSFWFEGRRILGRPLRVATRSSFC